MYCYNNINELIKVIDSHPQTNKAILAQQAKWPPADRHNKLCTFTVMHKMLYHNLSGKLYIKRWCSPHYLVINKN